MRKTLLPLLLLHGYRNVLKENEEEGLCGAVRAGSCERGKRMRR